MTGLDGGDALFNLQADGTVWFAPGVRLEEFPEAVSGQIISLEGPLHLTVYLPPAIQGGVAVLLADLVGFGQPQASAQVDSVTLTAGPVENEPPVAVDDQASAGPDTDVTISVLDNDSDVDGSLMPGTVVVSTAPAWGVAVANADGTITYAPQGFVGEVTFGYTVRDDWGDVSNEAIVTVTVGANTPPTADDSTLVVDEDIPSSGAVRERCRGRR